MQHGTQRWHTIPLATTVSSLCEHTLAMKILKEKTTSFNLPFIVIIIPMYQDKTQPFITSRYALLQWVLKR